MKQNEYDLFNNPMVDAAKKSMDPKDLEKYRLLGESMYKDIDFETGTINNSINDSLNKLHVVLMSGLHPSMLTDDEKYILESEIGKEWYKKYGYVEKDLTEMYTLIF